MSALRTMGRDRGARLIMLGALASALLFTDWASPALAHPELEAQIEVVNERIARDPNNADLHIIRGDLHRRHQDYAAALADFEAARDLSPDHTVLPFYQGRLALELGDAASAETLLQRFVVKHRDHAAAWRLLGDASLELGSADAAAVYYGAAIEMAESPSPALYQQQVHALLAAESDRTDEVLAVIDQGLARFGNEVGLLGLGVDAAVAAGDTQRAQAYLDRLPAGLEKLPAWRKRRLALNLASATD